MLCIGARGYNKIEERKKRLTQLSINFLRLYVCKLPNLYLYYINTLIYLLIVINLQQRVVHRATEQ
jgi:hypothetical protein